MQFPEQLKYTKDHEWVSTDGDIAMIGITEFAQGELGDIVFVDVSGVNRQMSRHDTFGSIEAVKTVSDLFLPVSGEIIEINAQLTDHPELINSDPYGKGWIIRVKMQDPKEVEELMSAEAYSSLVN
ncbi:MAG: glycine cleavage system protein GcvH [Chitinophagaceae bacterium]